MNTPLNTNPLDTVDLPDPQEPVVEANPNPCADLGVTEKARCLMVQHHQDVKKRDQSLLTRVAEDVGLSAEDAAQFSNHIQGKHAASASGYDRSHAAMS